MTVSEEDKDKIIKDFLDGIPIADICKNFGRNKTTIYRVIKDEGLTKKDFGRNIPTISLSEEEEKTIPAPKTKIDDESSIFDLFTAMGIKDNKKMQLYYSILALSKTAGVPPEDYIEEVVIPLMKQNLRSGIQLDDISINEFLNKKKKPEEKLHDLFINEAIKDIEEKKKEPEKVTPEEEVKLFEIKMKIYKRKKEQEHINKLFMIMRIFPSNEWMRKLFEYTLSSNDSELIKLIGTAHKLINKGDLNV